MGQYWELISIDAEQYIKWMGKMGEFFWERWDFIDRLIAPVIPPSYLEADFPVSSLPVLSKYVISG